MRLLVWLRFQWIGIALLPAAYLHFSDAVLRTTHHFSAARRLVVFGSYLFSGLLVFLALFTDTLVYDGLYSPAGQPSDGRSALSRLCRHTSC